MYLINALPNSNILSVKVSAAGTCLGCLFLGISFLLQVCLYLKNEYPLQFYYLLKDRGKVKSFVTAGPSRV